MAKKKNSKKNIVKDDCPDGVCPIKKKDKSKSKKIAAKSIKKNKDINIVVPIPAPIPISVPIKIPTNLNLFDKIKKKIFSTFGFGGE